MIANVSFPGILTDAQEIELPAFSFPLRILAFAPAVDIPPTSSPITIRIQNATGASPPNHIEATIAASANTGAVALGSVPITAGTKPIVRIVTANGAQILRGHFEIGSGITAILAADLTTLALVKEWLKIAGTDDDTLISSLVSAVSRQFHTYMGRIIPSASYTERVDLHGDTMISIRNPPLTTLTQVALEGDFGIYTEVVTAADLKVDAEAGQIFWTNRFKLRQLGAEVQYTGGFVTIPEDLQREATRETAHSFRHSEPGGGRLGLESNILDTGGTASYTQTPFLPGVRMVLDGYRRLNP